MNRFEYLPAGHFMGFNSTQVTPESITVEAGGDVEAGTVLGRREGSKLYAPLDPAATDGRQNAAGILHAPLPESAGPRSASAILRFVLPKYYVQSNRLQWPGGVTMEQRAAAIAQLEARGIRCVDTL
jgi:hypothetical protein